MERRAITVCGVVQGVGFRPFVYGVANSLGLAGCVRNRAGVVEIEAEGDPAAIDALVEAIRDRPPALAVVRGVTVAPLPTRGQAGFRIVASEASAGDAAVFVSPDVATCDACLAEMWDPGDRRHRYPFINCTDCGPRLTIITASPYDRPNTTMAGFPMCDDCRREYDDPGDRRFHAQPIACPVCGPRLSLHDAAGEVVETGGPLEGFVEAIAGGRIGALKGLGGFHLACDAADDAAVRRLRERKHRDEKPFAVMVADVAAAEALCEVRDAERALLTSPRRPIVLLRKRDAGRASGVADAAAPGNPDLGVMLPYTPLHHLLMRGLGRPVVMTSGNRADEPIATGNGEAVHRLGRIADVLLLHDRPIRVRCDDAVTRVVGGVELPVRRSRGYAPQPVALPVPCGVPTLAVGGQLKGTFALGRGVDAILSHHLGDLDHLPAVAAFEADVPLYEALFGVDPGLIVHDLHPDYATTRYATRRASRAGLPTLAVQHHHAHMAACMAEHGLTERVIGVSFDGTGYGTEGTVWGGEWLVGDASTFDRAAHLRTVGMPGGEAAIKRPWRMAAAHLLDAGLDPERVAALAPPGGIAVTAKMLDHRLNTPLTSSAGRLFDAVAAVVLGRGAVSYEGQAAMMLEWAAAGVAPDGAVYPIAFAPLPPGGAHHPTRIRLPRGAGSAPLPPGGVGGGRAASRLHIVGSAPSPDPSRREGDRKPLVLDTRALIRAVVSDLDAGTPPPVIARRFHETLAEAISVVCGRIRSATGLDKVTLSGGVFLNAVLTLAVEARLTGRGFTVYRHRRTPPNDGGLCLGQLFVAAAASAGGIVKGPAPEPG